MRTSALRTICVVIGVALTVGACDGEPAQPSAGRASTSSVPAAAAVANSDAPITIAPISTIPATSDGATDWPANVWFASPDESRADFLSGELMGLLGSPGVELSPVTRPAVESDGVVRYHNPLGEAVPVLVRAPGGERWDGTPGDAPIGAGLVVALHQTNDNGGAEPCGDIGTPFSYGSYFAEAGYLVVCPTLSFTGERQPVNTWDTSDFYAEYPTWSAMGKDISEVSWLLDALEVDGVDTSHVTLIGHSQGAVYSIFAAALDDRVDEIVANAGFVDTETDPDPERWSRPNWYRAYPVPPDGLDYMEVVAAVSPRCALLINYTDDQILQATTPGEPHLDEFESMFPSVDWAFEPGKHAWPEAEMADAVRWVADSTQLCPS